MNTSKRRFILAGVAGAVLALAAGGWWSYRIQAARAGLRDQLPVFVEPGPGRRAPSAQAMGVEFGKTSLPEVRAWLQAVGLDCPDTSMRALMQRMRETKRQELAERKARGEDVDSVSGASALNRRSPKEANPQVRLSCDGVPASALRDTDRRSAPGRLLLVFDSPAHPVRHVSYERTYQSDDLPRALADVNAARQRLLAALGPPDDPEPGPPLLDQLPWLSPRQLRWRFADLELRVGATNWGPKGIVVSEIVEVPWPVRADAPARAR